MPIETISPDLIPTKRRTAIKLATDLRQQLLHLLACLPTADRESRSDVKDMLTSCEMIREGLDGLRPPTA